VLLNVSQTYTALHTILRIEAPPRILDNPQPDCFDSSELENDNGPAMFGVPVYTASDRFNSMAAAKASSTAPEVIFMMFANLNG